MKLVLAIIHDEDAYQIMDILGERGFMVTKLASTGGFLRAGNTTLICGVTEDRIAELMELIEQKCKSRKQLAPTNVPALYGKETYLPYPAEITVGGATVFVMDVAEFKKV